MDDVNHLIDGPCAFDLSARRCPCGQPAAGWPGEGDDELCQDCWEAYCDRTWWAVITEAVRVARLPRRQTGGTR